MRIDSVFDKANFPSLILPNLRHLHLYHGNLSSINKNFHDSESKKEIDLFFYIEYLDLSELTDIAFLSHCLPRLTSFSIRGRDFYPDENLGKLLVSMITHFEQIIEMNINKDSVFGHCSDDDIRLLRTQQEHITKVLKNTPQLWNCNDKQIIWGCGCHLIIWL